MKIVLAPDKYKRSLTSKQVANAMERGIRKIVPEAEIVKVAISDGGEGLSDAFLSFREGRTIYLETTGPEGDKVKSSYALLSDMTAVIEIASTAGLALAKRLDPATATTCGVGEMILDSLSRNAKQILLGLGGSATNDAGCGIASCLGVRFFDESGQLFIPTGGSLNQITHIEKDTYDSRLKDVKITCLTDVVNPLYGPNGAAMVYAAQKGANAKTITLLDANLRYYASLLKNQIGFDSDFPGAGAAGGIPVSMKAFFNASVTSGVEFLLDTSKFSQKIADADMIITGEGRFDSQSLQGKAVSGILRKAKEANVPLYVLPGTVEKSLLYNKPDGIVGILAATPYGMNIGEAIKKSDYLVETAAKKLMLSILKK